MRRTVIAIVVLGTMLGFRAERGTAQSFVFRKQPVKDVNTGLVFRDTAGFKFDSVKIDNGECYELRIDYIPPVEGKLRITLTEFPDSKVSDGPDSQLAKTWSQVNKFTIWGKFFTELTHVEEAPDAIVTIGQGNAAVRFLKSTITHRKGTKEDINLYYVAGYRGTLIAIEASFSKSREKAGYREIEEFLAQFGKMFRSRP